MTNKYQLTEEHRSRFPEIRDKWIRNAFDTTPMTEEARQRCREAVIGMYRAAKLPPPKNIVFVPSPFVLRFASGFASAIWKNRRGGTSRDTTLAATDAVTRAATDAVTRAATDDATRDATSAATRAATEDATRDVTRAATDDATRDATSAATRAATEDATRDVTRAATLDAIYDATGAATDDATSAATEDAARAATDDATYYATEDATRAATEDATRDVTRAATLDAIYDATEDATDAATRAATRAATYTATLDATKRSDDQSNWYVVDCMFLRDLDKQLSLDGIGLQRIRTSYSDAWHGGNQWSWWLAYQDFFKTVAELGKSHGIDYTAYNHWETLGILSGPRTVYPDFCMISEKPIKLLVDNQNRPHCETGPFCEWKDGSKLYAVHGVRVPAWLVEQKHKITPTLIDEVRNAEIRRVMINFYGIDNYIKNGNPEVLDRDTDQYGRDRTLYRKKSTVDEDEDIVRVAVTNSSPELDGSYKTYFLPVHPELRPIKNGKLIPRAKKQAMTCHNAVASTFGEYGKDYKPVIES
jgi:hypothetical protein